MTKNVSKKLNRFFEFSFYLQIKPGWFYLNNV